jgi:lauroyl/myristoyl acyltransferase
MAERSRRLRRLRRRILFLFARTLMRAFGFSAARYVGRAVGAFQYLSQRRTRQRCLQDLAMLQNRSPDDPLVVRQLREAYRVYVTAVLEVLAMCDRKVDAKTLQRRCRIDGLPLLEAAMRSGGVILLVTHSGNSLLLAARLATEGWPMTVVYRQARMMSADFFRKGLAKYGIEGIPANDGLKAYAKMRNALRHRRIVFVMIDQGVKHPKDGVLMRFLGKDMPMPAGPAHLARRSGAPILPLVTLGADPAWHFTIEPAVPLTPGNPLEVDIETLVRLTERQLLERPQLWSWPYRRWRKFPLASTPAR